MALRLGFRRPPWIPMSWPLLGAIAGIVVAEMAPVRLIGAMGATTFILLIWLLLRFRPVGVIFAFLSVFGLFALRHQLIRQSLHDFPYAEKLSTGQALKVTAEVIVIGEPLVRERSVSFPARLRHLQNGDSAWKCSQRLYVRWRSSPSVIRCGDIIRLTGSLTAPRPPRNPGQFDLATWFRHRAIVAELTVNGPRLGEWRGTHPLWRVKDWALQARAWLQHVITHDIADDPTAAAVISAMTLGVREDLPEEVDLAFLRSGTLHIFSVSGLHVALVSWFIWRVFLLVRFSRRRAALLSIPAVVAYAWITGWQVASVRAAFMASLVLLGIACHRPAALLHGLTLSAFILLAWDSQQLFHPSFQLSFAVMLGLAVLTPFFLRVLQPGLQPDPFIPQRLLGRAQRWQQFCGEKISSSLSSSLAALVASAGLSIWHFQLWSIVSLVANLVLVPLAFIVLTCASLSIICYPLSPWLAGVFNHTNLLLARTSIASAEWFSRWPRGYDIVGTIPAPASQELQLCVLDLGEGGATIIRWPDGAAWLIDTGAEDHFRSIIAPALQAFGIEKIDTLVLTHGDIKHIGGAELILDSWPVKNIIMPAGEFRSDAYQKLSQKLSSFSHESIKTWSSGQSAQPHPWSKISAVYPPPHHAYSTADDNCLALSLQHGPHRVLLTSDLGFSAEEWLTPHLETHHLWIKGRHWRDGQTPPEFLKKLRPQIIVATGSQHLAPQKLDPTWVEERESENTRVYDLSRTGAVLITLTPREILTKTWLQP